MKNIAVIGSINMDLVTRVPHLPVGGETILGSSMVNLPGGKGANQAVALARLGNSVHMVGKLGQDQWGDEYRSIFQREGVDISLVDTMPDTATGIALIEVDDAGQNRIVVIPGANALVDTGYVVDRIKPLLQNSSQSSPLYFLFQLEIPLETVYETLAFLHENKSHCPHIVTIVDPAPAQPIPDKVYSYIDYLTPNESETEILTGIRIDNQNDIMKAGKNLLDKGCAQVIVKAGAQGAFLFSTLLNDQKPCIHVPAFEEVKTIDTTAAGDSFNAGLAHALNQNAMQGQHEITHIQQAIALANKVAGLSTTKLGAQSAMPGIELVGS